MSLSKKLLELMSIFNVSASNLASSINLDQTTLNKILNNKTSNPRIETVKSLSRYFNVDINVLINDNNEKNDMNGKDENFGLILKKLIVLNNNPSISSIAKESGVSKSIISNILNNKTTKPNVTTIKKLVKYFNIEPYQFDTQNISSFTKQNAVKLEIDTFLSTIPVIDIINAYDYINDSETNVEIVKYIKVVLPTTLEDSFAVQIINDNFHPEFIPPCYLIITKQEPVYNGFILAKLKNKILIYKFKNFNNYIELQEINSIKNIRLSKPSFTNIFIGSVYQTIVDLATT